MKIKKVQQNAKNEISAKKFCLKMETKINGAPKGIRIPVPSLKGWCPRPLDDGGTILYG